MPAILKDRVKETTTTTGTGTITLGGAVSGFRGFSVIGDGQYTYYTIAGQTSSEWEVGRGTYFAVGSGQVSRDTVFASSNSGSLVNFSAGTKDIFITYPADYAVMTADVQTLTYKRITPRIYSTTSVTSPYSWNSDSWDQQCFTALANALTINADSGTPTDGQKFVFRIKDNGVARALTWTTGTAKSFRAVGVTLPTTTVVNKTLYVGFIYNTADSRWDAVATAQEA